MRLALGDFGIPIAIATMVLLDVLINDTYTQVLHQLIFSIVPYESYRNQYTPVLFCLIAKFRGFD